MHTLVTQEGFERIHSFFAILCKGDLLKRYRGIAPNVLHIYSYLLLMLVTILVLLAYLNHSR